MNYENLILNHNANLVWTIDDHLRKIMEQTPKDTNLAIFETALLVRSISILFGITVLPASMPLSKYKELKERIVGVIKDFQLEQGLSHENSSSE